MLLVPPLGLAHAMFDNQVFLVNITRKQTTLRVDCRKNSCYHSYVFIKWTSPIDHEI
jgi:hypothetical protein